MSQEPPIAIVIEYDDIHCKVSCPHCGKRHYHGSNGGKNFEGLRVPHCTELRKSQYFVKITPETELVERVRFK